MWSEVLLQAQEASTTDCSFHLPPHSAPRFITKEHKPSTPPPRTGHVVWDLIVGASPQILLLETFCPFIHVT
ncbi:hypothetical protein AOLI_G00119280 [Acnodon oligacanthus]